MPALVVGLLDDVADQVQLDEVVVALDPHRRRRDALEEVVRDPVAAAVEVHRRRVGPLEPGDVVDGAVLDEVAAGRERLAVAAGHARPAAAERVHRAAEDAVAPAALDDDRVAAEPPQRAAGHQAVRAAADVDPVAAALLERQSEQRSRARRPPSSTNGLVEHAQDRLGLRPARRPRAEASRPCPVRRSRYHSPGRVEFAEHVHGVVALVLAVAVLRVGRRQRERPGVRVDRGDLLVLLEPVPEPVAVEADVRLVEPTARAGRRRSWNLPSLQPGIEFHTLNVSVPRISPVLTKPSFGQRASVCGTPSQNSSGRRRRAVASPRSFTPRAFRSASRTRPRTAGSSFSRSAGVGDRLPRR